MGPPARLSVSRPCVEAAWGLKMFCRKSDPSAKTRQVSPRDKTQDRN